MVSEPRVVSLLPSATEIAVALGAGDQLVGRSHECDFPAFVARLPVCTSTKLEKGLSSHEIEVRVQEIVRQGLSVYEVDAPLLRRLKPDVILTQSQCAVCAVTPGDLREALAAWVGREPVLLSLAPESLGDVWGDLLRVGEALGRVAEATAAVESLQARLERLRAGTRRAEHRPTVAAIEWIEPLMAAGNWIPELIDMAGGEPLLAVPGQHSPWLEWETLAGADPEVIVAMPCGYQLEQTVRELRGLAGDARWQSLRAVREGRVFAADGHHYFNRPGPRLVESAEILGEILRACGDGVMGGEGWVRVAAGAVP